MGAQTALDYSASTKNVAKASGVHMSREGSFVPASKGRVFVVEDHALTARGVKAYLELCGYDVDLADSIKAALSHAAANVFDVLLCDISLPDGTGWELLRKLQKKKPVTAIAYSAYDEPAQIERSKAAGFVDHIVKGATPEDLVSSIDRAMPRKSRR